MKASSAEGPASQQSMRRANLALVLGAVSRLDATSRAQVAEATGLTRAAAGSLVNELLEAGLLRERGAALEGRVGRPSTVVSLNDRGPAGLGLDVGVEHAGACVVDLRGEVRIHIRRPAGHRGQPVEKVVLDLAEVAEEALAAADELGLHIVGAGVAVPGLVGTGDTVVHAPNLGWHDVDLVGHLRARLPDRLRELPLELENEANLGALAELWRGAGSRDFVHVSAEAGIGAAVVVEGQLLRGRRGFAGELGHMPVYPEGRPCACGSHGCLEQYAGEQAVLRECGLTNAAEGTDRIALLAGGARAGHEPVRQALALAGRALGIALAGAVNLVDPETVVLAGAYAELADWLLPGMQAELGSRVRIRPWQPAGLVVSELRREGPMIGAATAVVQRVIADPSVLRG